MLSRQTVLFVGVDTAGSSVHGLFPRWMAATGVAAQLVGVDIPRDSPRRRYRRLVESLTADDRIAGAVVTAHKLSLFAACTDLLDEVDTYAEIAQEASCLFKHGGRVGAGASDPLALAGVLAEMFPPSYWRDHEAEVLCFGAGGAGTALALTLVVEQPKRQIDFAPPRRIIFADISRERLEALHSTLEKTGTAGAEINLIHVTDEAIADRALAVLPPRSLIVNATGLGKDAPGSPVGRAAIFPCDGVVLDMNYRGDLEFLARARTQQEGRRLRLHDGRRYFVHGWFEALAPIFSWPVDPETFRIFDAASG